MIEHTGIFVSNYKQAKEFYTKALKPLGYKLSMEFGESCGFMEGGHTSFWIVKKARTAKGHVAFGAKSRKAVRDFHEAAMRGAGKDNGKPGLRKDYSPDYYAAFILDKDGNNIEAVCFK